MSWREWCVGLLAVLGSLRVHAEVGMWRNFTSMKEVKAIARAGNTYWAASSGGLFAWEAGGSSFQLFTNAEGLRSVDLTAIGIDARGRIWTGTATGIIHVYSPESGLWRYITDIASANETNKRINSLTMYGDTVLISTDFGLSMFNAAKFEFKDTYKQFGSVPTNVRVAVTSAAIHDGKLWATVSAGTGNTRIAVASLSNPNLLPPTSWTLRAVGSSSNAPKNVTVFNGTLFSGTTDGLYYAVDESTWVAVSTVVGKNIVATASSSSVLSACTAAGEVYTVDAQNGSTQFGSLLPFAGTTTTISPQGQPVIGSLGGGILTLEGTWKSHFPNGPNSNRFLSVAVDPDGIVWGASGTSPAFGFYRYNGHGWKSFVSGSGSPLLTDGYVSISPGCNGSVWASSDGRGVVEIRQGIDSVSAEHMFGTNVGMVGVPNDPSFVVPGNVVCDNNGSHWMSVIRPANLHVFVVRTASGSWQTFPSILSSGERVNSLLDRSIDRGLAVDAFGSIWASVVEASFRGVIGLNNRGAIDSTADFLLNSTNGLPSDIIRTIVVDLDNDVWVGTDRGIGIILEPSAPLRPGGIASYRPLNGTVINTIAVDPLNQKWVGTPEGVVVLSQDGTQQIAEYTVANTNGKLIDNDVKSIAIDAKTGTVYFGTPLGLASLTTAGAAPKASFDELITSPNPYRVPNNTLLTIDGLVQDSRMKVLSIDGKLIRDIDSPGGRIGFWDGKDEQGRYVASGIYIIVAFSEKGDQVGTGKVAVVRK